jgi:hypothetical protein
MYRNVLSVKPSSFDRLRIAGSPAQVATKLDKDGDNAKRG